jgi:hypothetical protein
MKGASSYVDEGFMICCFDGRGDGAYGHEESGTYYIGERYGALC